MGKERKFIYKIIKKEEWGLSIPQSDLNWKTPIMIIISQHKTHPMNINLAKLCISRLINSYKISQYSQNKHKI